MKSKKIKFFLKAALSILIIVLLIYFVGLEKITNVVGKIKIEYFVFVIVFFLISTFLTTLAVLPLVKTRTYKMFKFKSVSWSTGMFLPSKIGEASFAVLLKKIGFSTKKSVAIFFIDRFVSFSIIGLLGLVGFLKYFEIKIDLNYLIVFVVVLLILLVLKNTIKKIKIIKKKLVLSEEARNYLKREKKAILINYFFSFVNFIFMFWVTQIIFLSLGQNVSLIDVGLISSLALFIGLIPITINGLGLREGTLVYLYSLVGVKPEYSILVAFVFLISSYFMAAIFLGLYWSEFSFVLKRKSEKADG